jgi:hypothetical protein
MVTVETALAIPMVLALTGVALWGLGAASASIALSDVGRSAARELARGTSQYEVLERVRAAMPDARTEVEVRQSEVIVRIHRFVEVPLPLLSGLGLDLSSSFVAPLEWSEFDA